MKIRYMCMALIGGISVGLKPNIFEDWYTGAKKWASSLTEGQREKMRQGVQDEALRTFNEKFIWEKGTKPQAARAYDYIMDRAKKDVADITSERYDHIMDRVKKDVADITSERYDYVRSRAKEDFAKIASKVKTGAAWTAGVAVLGAATYGLYRWAMRRGLGGIANDCKEIDSKFTGIFNQIDKKYSDLKLKAHTTDADNSLGIGLSVLIKSKVNEWGKKLEALDIKRQELKKIIVPIIKQEQNPEQRIKKIETKEKEIKRKINALKEKLEALEVKRNELKEIREPAIIQKQIPAQKTKTIEHVMLPQENVVKKEIKKKVQRGEV